MNKFFDTNILLYAIETGPKARVAHDLLKNGGTISSQVLNEFVRVGRRKYKLEFSVIAEFLAPIKATFSIVDVSLACHERAFDIAAKDNIGIYDANIIAAAELSGCDTLYTEDLNNGQRIGKLAIVNPFE